MLIYTENKYPYGTIKRYIYLLIRSKQKYYFHIRGIFQWVEKLDIFSKNCTKNDGYPEGNLLLA